MIYKTTKMISLDTSTTETGCAVFENGILRRIEEIINPLKKGGAAERLEWMGTKIKELISKEKPDIVVIEEMAVARGFKTQKVLSQLIGYVRGICSYEGAEFWSYSPSEWRKECLDDGEANPERIAGRKFKREDWKAWSVDRVQRRYAEKISSDDAADAVLIGIAHLNYCKRNQQLAVE